MLVDSAYVLAGLVLLFFGGEALVRGSVAIAERMGISKLVVGLVIVGFGTSAPELLVSVQAALDGAPDISIGNVVGSNIANVLLVIGLAAAIAPVANTDRTLRRDLLVLVASAAFACALFLTGEIGRLSGLALVAGLAAYLGFSLVAERRRRKLAQGVETQEDEIPGAEVGGLVDKPAIAALAVLGGIAALVFGARLLVTGATGIARDFGVSEAVIGLTIVAIGTSLPELATALVAAVKREAEVVLANVVGSGIFNVLCILGITALIAPIPVAERFAYVDGPIMLAISVLAALFLWYRDRIGRLVGAGMLVVYGAYIAVQNAL